MEVNWHDKTNTYTPVSTKTVEIGKKYPLAGTIAVLLWLICFQQQSWPRPVDKAFQKYA